MLVSVVFSFRNEESVLDELIDRTLKAFDTLKEDVELIFVNDASTDQSLAILKKHAEKDDRIKVINMSRCFGVSECVLAGMAYAKGDAVVYMDADLQDPPEVIPKLIARWHDGADVVYTVRTKRQGESKVKMGLTWLAYRFVSLISTVEVPKDAGDFKLLSRKVVRHLLKCKESNPYLRGLVSSLGFKQAPVYYERAERHDGETHFPFFSKNPWVTFVSGITSFSFFPLYLILFLGLLGLGFSSICLVIFIIKSLIAGSVSTGLWVSGALFLWSWLMFGMGVLGIYLLRMYKDIRFREPYIIESTIGLKGEVVEE